MTNAQSNGSWSHALFWSDPLFFFLNFAIPKKLTGSIILYPNENILEFLPLHRPLRSLVRARCCYASLQPPSTPWLVLGDLRVSSRCRSATVAAAELRCVALHPTHLCAALRRVKTKGGLGWMPQAPFRRSFIAPEQHHLESFGGSSRYQVPRCMGFEKNLSSSLELFLGEQMRMVPCVRMPIALRTCGNPSGPSRRAVVVCRCCAHVDLRGNIQDAADAARRTAFRPDKRKWNGKACVRTMTRRSRILREQLDPSEGPLGPLRCRARGGNIYYSDT